eukprot:TRINITY_DN5076_c0_g1_i1.p1 TRINITY_DN5076_c0_g1~~TRINITY_DN5076_c0_g1_i1.p1  ORF type:complete len:986 (+),score=251.05 TRINITY_DN5076_c0_g1_i1:63-3020(+)
MANLSSWAVHNYYSLQNALGKSTDLPSDDESISIPANAILTPVSVSSVETVAQISVPNQSNDQLKEKESMAIPGILPKKHSFALDEDFDAIGLKEKGTRYGENENILTEIRKYLRLPSSEEFLEDQPAKWIGSFESSTDVTNGTFFLLRHYLVFLEVIPRYFPLREGYVEKGQRGKNGKINKWTVRYLSLTANSLVLFFDSSKKFEYRTSGIIPFQDIHSVGKAEATETDNSFCFEVSTSRKLYVFSCKNENEMNEWIAAIKDRIEAKSQISDFQTRKEAIIPLRLVSNIECIQQTIFPNLIRISTEDEKEFLFSLEDRSMSWDKIDMAWREVKARELSSPRSMLRDEADSSKIHEYNDPETNAVQPISLSDEEFRRKHKFLDPKSSQSIEFHSRMEFPDTEYLIHQYHCTYASRIPLTGHLYISKTYISFWSGVLGQRHTLIIPWTDIVSIEKSRWRESWSLHAVRINTKMGEKPVVFSHFPKRESALELLNDCLHHLSQSGELIADTLPSNERKATLNSPGYEVFNEPSWNIEGKGLRITMLIVGTRGDVQPFIALALGLEKIGHKVKIATHEHHRKFVGEYGLQFFPLAGDPKELVSFMVKTEGFNISFLREGLKKFTVFIEELLDSCWEACKEDTDVIIENPPAFGGPHVAEKLNIPLFCAFTMPWSRTTETPHPFAMPTIKGGPAYNWASYVAVDEGTFTPVRGVYNRFRHKLGLPSISFVAGHSLLHLRKVPFLYCWSPNVMKKPSDWPEYLCVTGYWFLEGSKDYKPDQKLVDFLEKGSKPIYIGFGSVSVGDPDELTKNIIEAVKSSGHRAIMVKGWGEYKDDQEYPEEILCLDNVPHDWLFPRCAAVIHHGGAGTTAAGLRAGCPTMIVPFFGDQYFWGQRIAELGVGLPPLTLQQIKKELGPSIKKLVEDQSIRTKAQAISEHIKSQDGVGRAIEFIHKELANQEMFEKPSSPAPLKESKLAVLKKKWVSSTTSI